MFDNLVLYSRLLVTTCAAAMLFIACSSAAKVHPTLTQGYVRVKLNVLRPLSAPDGQQAPLSAAPPPADSGARTKTDEGGNTRETLSFINRRPQPAPYAQGGFGLSQNSRDNGRPRVRITKVQSSGLEPASRTSTGNSPNGPNPFGGRQSKKHEYAPPRGEENIRNLHSSNYFSQNRDNGYTKTSDYDDTALTTGSSKVGEDENLGKSSPFPSQTNRLQGARPVTTRGRYSDYRETNRLPGVEAEGGSSGRSNVLIFRGHAAPRDASPSHGNPSREERTSGADFSQNQLPASSRETLGHRNILSYLFKDSPTQSNAVAGEARGVVRWAGVGERKRSPAVAQEKIRFGLDSKRLSTMHPVKEDPGGRKEFPGHRIRIYPSRHVTTAPPQAVFHPAAVEGKHLEGFVPAVPLHAQDRYTPSRKTFVPVDQVNSSSGEPERGYKPGQSIKRISRLGGFANPVTHLGPPPNKKSDFQQSTLDKGTNYQFKFANLYSHLSPKYSFELKGASATTTAPAKPDRTESSSPAPVIHSPSGSTPRPFTTGFKPFGRPPPESVAGTNRNSFEKHFSLYKGRFGLKGFGTRPLEGAKALPQEPSAPTKTGFKGFKLRRSQTRGPERVRIHRHYNRTGEPEPRSVSVAPVSPNETSGDGFKPVLKTTQDSKPLPEPAPDDRTNMVQTFQLLLRPAQAQRNTSWTRAEENSIRSSDVLSSSYLRSAGRLETAPRAERKLSDGDVNGLVTTAKQMTVFRTPTSSTVSGVRVKSASSRRLNGYTVINATRNIAIIRGPRVKAVTYADIVGSASFSSVRAAGQLPVAPTDEDYFPNVTMAAEEEQKASWTLKSESGRNASISTEASREDDDDEEEDDFISVEKTKFGADDGVETLDLFFGGEGSGSGDSGLSEGSSHAAGKNLLELDYLRKSTGSVFFKSVTRSHLDPQ
ncbi:uncharacterized protein LOC108241805 [Kryptolebias marmoratus]|uniref:uncharacterized protein LOC108241805 n=1 Tax=Kryptolebias marmoratus TaxID=37003 RepID=UPI0007F8EE4F|nr:uncharacterized protein LOC108241805 [Kryptolebias marmoratus]